MKVNKIDQINQFMIEKKQTKFDCNQKKIRSCVNFNLTFLQHKIVSFKLILFF
jgi:hypothetical protein